MMFMNGGRLGDVRVLSASSVAEMGRDQTRICFSTPYPHFTGDWAGMVAQSGLAAVGVTAWHKNGGTLTYGPSSSCRPNGWR